MRRELCQLINGPPRVLIEAKRLGVELRRKNPDRGVDEFNSMTFQLQVFDDLWQQRPGTAGKDRTTKAGMNFFGDARAADNRPSLKDKRLQSCFREIKSSDQTVMAGADDDNVTFCHCGRNW